MNWVKDKEWHGNPELNLDSWHKFFNNPLDNNRKVKVFVFGKDKSWKFCVSAGKNSDFSYTGSCAGTCDSREQMMKYVDLQYSIGKLFR